MKYQRTILGKMMTLQRGFDLPEQDRKNGDIPIVTSSGITGYHNHAPVKGPGVITGRYGTIGVVHYVEGDYWPHNTTLFVKDFKGNNPLFLRYLLTSLNLANQVSSGAVPGVNRNVLHAMWTYDVPPAKQDIIAETLFSYDDLIENNRRRIALLEESARLLYQEWFVRLRFPGCEHTRIVDGVPEGWKKVTLGEVIELKYGKALKAENRKDGEIPVYGSSGTVGFHNEALVKGPGIVVGRKGNVGAVYWVDSDFYPIDTVYYISPDQCSKFMYFNLLSRTFLSSDVAVPGLNRGYAHSQNCIVPKSYVIEHFEKSVDPIFKQMGVLRNFNNKLSQARDLLLPKLMSGEVMV